MTTSKKSPNLGTGEVGYKKPPKNRQFGQPEGNKMAHGFWKKESTARYKLEQMMKLNKSDLSAIIKDADAPVFEHKLARCLLDGNWKEIEGMMNQVYGYPKQEVEQTNIELKPILPKKDKK